MSKGQKRSGREPKKPKRTKQKTAVSKTTAVPTQNQTGRFGALQD